MLKEMWAINSFAMSPTCFRLSFTRRVFTKAKSIMNVMPVTRSGFTMGSWDAFRIRFRGRFFML